MPYYLESSDEKLSIQMNNFASKIDSYAIVFGLNSADTGGIKADALAFSWGVNNLKKVITNKQNWTGYKNILLKGEGSVSSNTVPTAPLLDAVPAAVAPGVLLRFTTLVNRMKAHQMYTTAIGQNLGIEAAAGAAIVVTDAKPVLKAVMSGSKVILQWSKGNYNGIHIEKDSGTGFVMLDKDFMPDYIDNTPLPVGTSALWKYRAIYLLKHDQVGQWSDEVSITVSH